MEKQKTIAKAQTLSGIALHTGERARLGIMPADENTGIVFRRIDLPGAPGVRALASNVVDVRRGTVLGAEGRPIVYTVEHIMSALHAGGIDNAVVEMDGGEPPILDGSAHEYFQMVREAGSVEQSAEALFYTPSAPLYVDAGDTQLVITPRDGELKIHCTVSYHGCPVDPQFASIEITPENFEKEVACARTFVEYRDLKALSAMGLVKGGSLDAAAIIHEGAIICKDELRFQDEIVRHKILDIVGDLYLCGRRVRANVIAIKPGHPRNVELAGLMLKEIMLRKDS